MDRKQIIAEIAERSGKTKWAIKKDIRWAEKNLGVTPKYYYKKNFEQLSHFRQAMIAERSARLAVKAEKEYENLAAATQKDIKSIKKEIKNIANKYNRNITKYDYGKYGLWEKSDEEIENVFAKVDKIESIKDSILEELAENYDNDSVYNSIQTKYEEIISIYKELIDPYYIAKLIDKLKASLTLKIRELEAITLDMEATKTVFSFNNSEYIMFGFINLKIKERLEFLSDKEKDKIFSNISTSSAREILFSKWNTYERLKEYFRREIISIDSRKEFKKFKKFVKKHRTFCIKPTFGSIGRGIKKMSIDDFSKCKKIFSECIEEEKQFVLEELIVPSKKIYDLNPDSVNTIRVTVCRTEEDIIVDDTFMKIGRKGSFVDNGGAGGILVHIDEKTGRFDSDGVDEKGIRYEKHPDSGIVLQGYQLPDWDNALSLAKEATKEIPELQYIGWDLTHTDEGWIIVEGNSWPQFYGQQATVLKGKRAQFLNIIGYKNVPPSAFKFEKIDR